MPTTILTVMNGYSNRLMQYPMSFDIPSLQAELERILISRCFRSRRALQKFLRYIVEESLAGNAIHLTQHNIAINGLSRDKDFDDLDNPLVRVQAGRLRKQLEDYYATEGRFNPIRIELPVGSYRPIFHQQPLISEETEQYLSQGPTLVCIPRTFVADDTVGEQLISSLTRDYVNALTHFNFFQVMFADEIPWQRLDSPQEAWLKYNADFALFVDLHSEHNGYNLKCSLVHRTNNQIIWAHSFPLGNQHPSSVALQQIFKRIAHDTVGYESGCIHTYWARQLLASGKPIAEHHQVMLALRQQIWTFALEDFHTVLQICEERLEKFPQDIPAMVVYAELCRSDYLLKYKAIKSLGTRTAQIATALMQQAPSNAYSHLYYAMHCLFEEDHEQCHQALLKARNINPLDTHLTVVVGLMHMGMGDWRTGADYIQASINMSHNYPDWYHIPLSVYHYRAGRYLAALREAKKIRLNHLWGPMLRTAMYRRNQFDDKASVEFQQMAIDHPQFMQESQHIVQGLTPNATPTLKKLWSNVPTQPLSKDDDRRE